MIKDLISQIEAIKEQLYTKISELPDNANIKRLDIALLLIQVK